MVLAPTDFRDEEYSEPYTLLTNLGALVTTASLSTAPAKGMFGKVVAPQASVKSVRGDAFDAVIFIGGTGVETHRMPDNPDLHRIAKEAFSAGKLVAAICIAPKILASSGLLKGKKATVYLSGSGDLRSKGAIYTGKEVEVDGNIVTANGPHAARLFGTTLARMLGHAVQ